MAPAALKRRHTHGHRAVTATLRESRARLGTVWAGLPGWAEPRQQAGAPRSVGRHAQKAEAVGRIRLMHCLSLFFFFFI
jgi:hypothetical protein